VKSLFAQPHSKTPNLLPKATRGWHSKQKARTLDPAILRAGCVRFCDHARLLLIAELDRQPAGQMMITYEWSDWRNGVFW
jgi:hypothetical protein